MEPLYAIYPGQHVEQLPAGAPLPAGAVGLARHRDLPTFARLLGALDAGAPEPTEDAWRAAIERVFGPAVVRAGVQREARAVLAAIEGPEATSYREFVERVNR